MAVITVLIKPSSSSCNLSCSYCFYKDISNKREIKNYGMMDYNTLNAIIQRVYKIAEGEINFIFQGGEPTLVGLDYYKELIYLQEKHNVKGLKIYNSIQTNGILIDEKWAKFLSENNFLVGLSLDGPKDIHDLNRKYLQNKGSYKEVERAVILLNKYNVNYNILCVVTKNVARHIIKVYNYYSKMGFKDLQFIPCLDRIDQLPGQNPYSLTPKIYGDFLIKLFNLWYRDIQGNNGMNIRMFQEILNTLSGNEPQSCHMGDGCSMNLVIESDGSAYPCDFYVLDNWKLGNLKNDNILDIYNREKAYDFINESKTLSVECGQCEYYFICRGGCRRHYEPLLENKKRTNYFCEAYKTFYKYSLDEFYRLLQ